MVKQATEKDIPVIEEILLDAVNWLKKSKLENGWNETSIKWDNLSKDYKIENFFIAYKNEKPAAIMALTDLDKKYWPEVDKGDSLYLHKLAVKREFSGRGLSKELINFAKKYALANIIKYAPINSIKYAPVNSIRLDCNFHRKKLRELYENEGFCFVKKVISNNSDMALYVWSK